MKIRELIERERYVKNTIDEFSKEIKKNTDLARLRLNLTGDDVAISKTTCKQVAMCLDWLKIMITQTIDNMDVDITMNELPDYF